MCVVFFLLMRRRPPRSTQSRSSAASDVYKRQIYSKAQEFRTEALKKYGEEVFDGDDSTGQFRIKPENVKDFENELRTEFDAEIELSSAPIDPERLPDSCLTGAEAISLGWLWKVEGE